MPPPTADDIRRMYGRLNTLLKETIPQRRPKKTGRLSKYETARKRYIESKALPAIVSTCIDRRHVTASPSASASRI